MNLYLPADLPGLRDNWIGCLEWTENGVIRHGIITSPWLCPPAASYMICVAADDMYGETHGYSLMADRARLPLSRQEVQFRALSWMAPEVLKAANPEAVTSFNRLLLLVALKSTAIDVPQMIIEGVASLVLDHTEPDWVRHHEWAKSVLEKA